MTFKNTYLLLAILSIFCCGCRKAKTPSVSFYYWKTTFALNETENRVLQANKVQQLYVRYFDVTVNKKTGDAQPVGIIRFDKAIPLQKVVPVIYIKKEVFEQRIDIDSLCEKIYRLATAINHTIRQKPQMIQFDCDWTLETKAAYFHFLQQYKKVSKQPLSATIRLHQIKHRLTTGVPPVDRGVLMFYNMGKIEAGEKNSVFDAGIASAYLGSLDTYPLKLDIALPVFSWSMQIRNGQVAGLLNKMNAAHFTEDTCFRQIRKNRFKVLSGCFKGGYYFRRDDEIKVESISPGELETMVRLIRKHSKKTIQQVIFYDLDHFNLKNYETNIYEQTAHLFD